MHKKNKRILWLLNHRTLMPYEAPLIRRLGFEIYVPKVIPKSNFRSGAIDFRYDSSLSLPTGALKELNGFNFYEEVWPAKIVTIVNRYFGTAFVIPHARQVAEAVEKFEGQIVFRAFGLDNSQSYRKVLDDLYGPLVLRKINGIKTRFWFGEGYDNLHECDDPIFSERAVFLPIGVPDSFFANAGQWTGSVRKILFVCPYVVSNPYYAEIYRRFKKDFGHFPHIIVGAQDVPVSDPHVLGFVSDEELKRLYLECAVLYYPSTEQRHVHYSPIEAAISGMPIVFFESSLLARLSKGAIKGRVASVREAQQVIERILDNDVELISQIKSDQKDIAFHFSDEYCAAVWKRELDARGFMRALEQQSRANTTWREVKRALLMPFAHGRISIDPHRRAVQPAAVTLTAGDAESKFGCSLYGGIRFSEPEFPEFVDYVSGVSGAEHWGRWSTGETVLIVLKHNLAGQFRLLLRAVGFGRNASIPIPVRIAGQARTVQLPLGIEEAKGAWLHFNLKTPCNVIEVKVPHPTRPEMDGRTIGIGFIELRTAQSISLSAADARELFGASLSDGIDFARPEFPSFVESVQGMSVTEPWGRWSTGKKVVIELKHTLHGPLRLLLRAVGYGRNAGARVTVRIGGELKTLRLPRRLRDDAELSVEFDICVASNVIEFTVPHPTFPPNDDRAVGIGFYGIRCQELWPATTLADNAA